MKKLLLIILIPIFLIGCSPDARNTESPSSKELKTSDDGFIKYKIVKIEGKRFVATQTYYGYWTLAGPID